MSGPLPCKLVLAGAHTPGRRGVSAEQVGTAPTAFLLFLFLFLCVFVCRERVGVPPVFL